LEKLAKEESSREDFKWKDEELNGKVENVELVK
jgi:hypothetical protein